MSILITICARGGSKGIPGKNIKLLNSKPLIGYTIETAFKFQEAMPYTDISLSTDSDEIKKVTKNFGLNTEYSRPEFLASDTAGKIDVINDILNYSQKTNEKKYDYILDMDVTSPLRNINDLINAFKILESNTDALNIFSVSQATRNPYFNIVEQKENGFYAQVKTLQTGFLTRQSAPSVYDMNASFYFYRKLFFERKYKSAITDKSLIYIVPHICFDLDHQIDFDFLSYLIKNKILDFEF